jgi:hypothetical protein
LAIDDDPAWLAAGFDERKPKARMAGVLKAIDEGGPLGLLSSVYEQAARSKHRDSAKASAELLREAQARRTNPGFVLAAFEIAAREETGPPGCRSCTRCWRKRAIPTLRAPWPTPCAS